jgi:endoglycosylceramidase
VPLFIGEFGGFGSIRGVDEMIADQCRLLDRHFVSWTAWHYNPTDVDWNDEDASFVQPDGSDRPWTSHLIRPYPRALAGEPKSWSSGRGEWRLEYTATSKAPTEIVVPARWRGSDLDLAITGASHEWNPDTSILSVTASPGEAVMVQLAPR